MARVDPETARMQDLPETAHRQETVRQILYSTKTVWIQRLALRQE